MSIGDLQKGFDQIMIDCEYADCKIYMDDDVGFQLDVLAEYGSIHYLKIRKFPMKNRRIQAMKSKVIEETPMQESLKRDLSMGV